MFLQMIPFIIEAIKKIEEFLPVPGVGKDKLALIRESLSAIFKEVDSIWPAVETLVAALVKMANASGIFKKSE